MTNTTAQEHIIKLSKQQQTVLVTLFILGVRRIGVTPEGKLVINSCKTSAMEGTILGKGYPATEQFLFAQLLEIPNPNNYLMLEEVVKKYCDEYPAFSESK